MTPNEAKEITFLAMQTALSASARSSTILVFDGIPYVPTVGSPHILFSVRHVPQASRQETLGSDGNRRFERYAIALAECCDIGARGSKACDELVDIVVEAFEGERISGVEYEVAQQTEAGDDGTWYRILASVPFRYYVTK